MARTTIRDYQHRENRTRVTYTSNTTLTATIPADNTIPQNTEGTQILSASITPQSTTSTIRVTFSGFGAGGSNLIELVSAMFVGAAANAVIAASSSGGDGGTLSSADRPVPLSLVYEFTSGTLSPLNVNIRVGASSGNMAMNGVPGAQRFGGVSQASILLEEILT